MPDSYSGNILKLMIVAVEPSGDMLGSELIKTFREKKNLELSLYGCGGPFMEAEGFNSAFPIKSLSVMGFLDVAKVIPEAKRRIGELARTCKEQDIAGVVFVDGWAFSRLGAEMIRKHSPETKLFKYVAPQVWASRPKRINFVKKYFDGVLTVLPFETSIFQNEGIQTHYVGNSVFQKAKQKISAHDSHAFKQRYAPENEPLLAILPGSRKTEISRLAPPFLKTVDLLKHRLPDLKLILPVASSVENEVRDAFTSCDDIHFIGSDEKYTAFATADAALVASGTVTTELAIHRTPMIIAYRFDSLTALWAKTVLNIKYASILSIMADRELIPEFLQENCKPEAMAEKLYSLLTDPLAREEQICSLEPVIKALELDGPPAGKVAAETILGWLNKPN